jgi:hypothetical protein
MGDGDVQKGLKERRREMMKGWESGKRKKLERG